ncbi:hypothetical protein [Frigidibacter mobilis]|uniref:Uncharacterized protein n=1 Tax=Frigidibacter mobilis TaxID=1335048 RepID=A0A159Z696_9RHOB|nr:hypothetical protein [Frigidibacter mobilis]AMY70852.1 hypothetical protein AKL17_3628 [Frigidibacter mobilis]
MSQANALMVTGAVIGLVLGSSMGIAVGGTAYNAAVFLTPLGAFIGWLISRSIGGATKQAAAGVEPATSVQERPQEAVSENSVSDVPNRDFFERLVWSVLALLATLWNFQIDLLDKVGVLPTFVRQPLLFAGLCIVISVFFPPALVIYFLAWLGANHFKISEETSYRATIK